MSEAKTTSFLQLIAGLLMLALSIAVFAIRLKHPGDYAMPGGGAFIGALALLLFGVVLLWLKPPRGIAWIILAVSPVAMFPAIYSIVGESEEVISLYATDSHGQPADLRLWIVDREDGAWVGMSRDKAIEHTLDGARLQMLRAGTLQCVIPALTKSRETTKVIHSMKVEKYAAARLAGAIGMYPMEATDKTAALRLDPCLES